MYLPDPLLEPTLVEYLPDAPFLLTPLGAIPRRRKSREITSLKLVRERMYVDSRQGAAADGVKVAEDKKRNIWPAPLAMG